MPDKTTLSSTGASEAAEVGEEAFRAEVRGWIGENFPPALRGHGELPFHLNPDPANQDYTLWRQCMADKGWGVPTWPRELGGAGLGNADAAILGQELARAGAFNPIGGLGVKMLGPTLLELGTPEQIAQHVPPIARGERRWCQGFSEPGAGSDLAALSTRAEDIGDHWLINGQKIWTSGANISDWCFCLVRTDTKHKQGGITFLLIDMATPGIETRTIKLINGVSHFCEVFLTDVKVPKENTVGPANGGWTVAKRLLQHERGGLASDRSKEPMSLTELAKRYAGEDELGRILDADLRVRLIMHAARSRAYALTLARVAAETKAGLKSIPVSVLKNLGAGVAQLRAELALEIIGADALGAEGEQEHFSGEAAAITNGWLYSKSYSIYGGTHEVQNNITSKAVLELPSS